VEVVIPMNGDLPLLYKAGADAIGSFVPLAPIDPRPEAEATQILEIGVAASPVNRNTIKARDKNAASHADHDGLQPIKHGRSRVKQWFEALAGFPQFGSGKGEPWGFATRIKTIVERAASPGGDNRRPGGLIGTDSRSDTLDMLVYGLRHFFQYGRRPAEV
jgi:hypothetical protein